MRVLLVFGVIILASFKISNGKIASYNMSVNVLKLISTNPDFVPTRSSEEKCKSFLDKLFKTHIDFKTTPGIEFIDQGSNFEAVFCNYCGKKIDMQIWQDAMDNAHKSQFTNLSFITSCCKKKGNLNDLKYYSPAGFAKFQITISNPDEDIKESDLQQLEKILGTPIRKIWAHY